MKPKLWLFAMFLQSMVVSGQSGEWTWMKGDSSLDNPSGIYGTQGVADTANTPAGFYEPGEWTDLQDNFWLFGGLVAGLEAYGDLWKYNPAINSWTWVRGGGANSAGHYGTLGVASPANNPPARAWGMSTWTDLNGNLWLYGGYGVTGVYSDLWKYNISTNMWVWMQGPSTVDDPPVYGIQGIPSSSNSPGARYEASATWVDGDNNLWLFGGSIPGGSSLNDLWRYNTATNEWTWMKGANVPFQMGNYGVKGVPDSSNVPGARRAYCSWTDAIGNFWLFGGQKSNTPAKNFNDMWRYEPATNNWTWMSGTNIGDSPGNYGPTCVSSVNYVPAARTENRVRWKDLCGNFWLFGGGRGDALQTLYNDLWCFNPVTLEWTLVKGGGPLTAAVYGIRGVSNAANMPYARAGSVGWTSANGDLYFFGGSGFFVSTGNDLWKFVINPSCPATSPALPITLGNDTVLCNGDILLDVTTPGATYLWQNNSTNPIFTVQTPGVYSVTVTSLTGCTRMSQINVSSSIVVSDTVSNASCGDSTGSIIPNVVDGMSPFQFAWSNGDTTASLYNLAGGNYTLTITDSGGCRVVKNYTVNNGISQVAINSDKAVICAGDSALLCAPAGYSLYQWNTGEEDRCFYAKQAGNYYVTVTDTTGCAASSNHVFIDAYPSPPVSISVNGDTLVAYNAVSYSWYLNGEVIPGATSSILIANGGGLYAVMVTDSNGCSSFSNPIFVSSVAEVPSASELGIRLFPNPSQNNTWQLQAGTDWLGGQLEIINVIGKQVYTSVIENRESELSFQGASGVYVCRVHGRQRTVSLKLLKL